MTLIIPPAVKESDTFEQAVTRFPLKESEVNQGVEVPNTKVDGYSPIIRNKAAKDGPFSNVHKDYTTFYQMFEKSLEANKHKEFLGRRATLADGKPGNYVYETYAESAEVRTQFGSGLLNLVAEKIPNAGENFILSLYSGNTYEWIVADLACHAYNITNTTLYDSLGPESSRFILMLTESPVILLAKEKIQKILDLKSSDSTNSLSFVKLLISMEKLDSEKDKELIKSSHELGFHLTDFATVCENGAAHPVAHRPPKPDDLLTISFTSGTSGTPKGVELTHANFVAGVTMAFCHIVLPDRPFGSFCFLPLAHVLERFKLCFEIVKGAKVGLAYNPGDVRSFLPDIKVFNDSTHLCVVPRVYSKIEQGLKTKLGAMGGFAGKLIRSIVAFKQFWDFNLGMNGSGYINKVLNKLFLVKIRKQLGFEYLDFLICGGAPINAESVEYLRSVLGVGFYVGYGLSESFAAIAITTKHETNLKSVGPIGVTCELKLRDLPELDYTWSANRSGEIMLRGPQMFSGYFKDPKKTEEALDADGWFHTGDVGCLDKDGKLMVVDRVKNFFKLSQGEYIAAEKIENIYMSNCVYLEQLFVYGNSFKDHLVAIAGVTPEGVYKLLQEKLVSDKESALKVSSVEETKALLEAKDPALQKLLLAESNTLIAHSGLYGFEKIKNAYFLIDPLTIDNDCMTPTLKLKRPNCAKVFASEIEELYAKK